MIIFHSRILAHNERSSYDILLQSVLKILFKKSPFGLLSYNTIIACRCHMVKIIIFLKELVQTYFLRTIESLILENISEIFQIYSEIIVDIWLGTMVFYSENFKYAEKCLDEYYCKSLYLKSGVRGTGENWHNS